MEKKFVEIVFILDRSGSMEGLEKDTIGGFNGMIAKQKKEEGKVFISTVLFDDRTEVLHDRVDLEDIQPMTEKEYYVRGSTALLDAVGGAIHHIGLIHKYARKEDRPDKTMFVIMTDGYENASRQYRYEDIRRMIERQKEKYGWEFMFIGANMDAISEAAKYGINADMAVEYCCDSAGTAVSYDALGDAVSAMRVCGAVPVGWKKKIVKDYKNRKRKGGFWR